MNIPKPVQLTSLKHRQFGLTLDEYKKYLTQKIQQDKIQQQLEEKRLDLIMKQLPTESKKTREKREKTEKRLEKQRIKKQRETGKQERMRKKKEREEKNKLEKKWKWKKWKKMEKKRQREKRQREIIKAYRRQQLFSEQNVDTLSKFCKNPTYSNFSKLNNKNKVKLRLLSNYVLNSKKGKTILATKISKW